MKKAVVILLALTMILGLGITVFAAGTNTISVKSDDTHTYEVYQIFTGDLADGVLSNVKWGKNGTGTKGETVDTAILDKLTALADKSDSEKLAEITKYVDLTSAKIASIDKDHAYTAENGYYLIKDVTPFEPEKDADGKVIETENKYIVEVVEDVEITRKADKVPFSDKVIVEGDDEVKVNEAGIGDTVTYKITANIPSSASEYDYYYFIINDTMEKGLTFQSISSVKAGDADAAYTLKTGTDAAPYTFELALTDAKANAGKTVTVIYTALVNENAEIGTDSNDNEQNLTYSNNPNYKYDGTNDSHNPGFPDSTKDVPTGETPDNKTETYVTELTVSKVDENGKVLTGAEFMLTGDTNKVLVSTETSFAKDAEGTYYKLKNGTYTTDAPVAADTMKPAAADASKGYVKDNAYMGADRVSYAEEWYRPYVPATDAGKDVFVLVKANIDEYESTSDLYKKTVTASAMGAGTEKTTIKAEVGADGTVSFTGLGAGSYTLTEIKTPAGYNTCDAVSFVVSFNSDTKTFYVTAPVSAADNTLGITIVNQKGATLPETGGMGTTMLIIVGAVLFMTMSVVLVTKKRMYNEG